MLPKLQRIARRCWIPELAVRPRLPLKQSQVAIVAAVVLSLLVHGLILAGPGWARDDFVAPPVPLYARLLEAPAPAPLPQKSAAARVAPKQPATSKPAPAIAPVQTLRPSVLPDDTSNKLAPLAREAEPPSSASLLQAEQATAQTLAAAEGSGPEVITLAEMAASGGSFTDNVFKLPVRQIDDWAREGCIDFAVTIKSIDMGQARHCWQHDEGRYSASFKASAQILFRRFSIDQASVGRVIAGVPVSDVFRDHWDSKYFETLFLHGEGRVVQNRNGDKRELPTGGAALDILALMHFMARQNAVIEPFDMFVVANRGNVSRVTVVQQVPATLELPAGKVIAQQYHVETRGGDLKIDIWIGLTVGNAPVRLRIENNGDVFDFRARHVQLDGQVRLMTPEPSPPMPSQE